MAGACARSLVARGEGSRIRIGESASQELLRRKPIELARYTPLQMAGLGSKSKWGARRVQATASVARRTTGRKTPGVTPTRGAPATSPAPNSATCRPCRSYLARFWTTNGCAKCARARVPAPLSARAPEGHGQEHRLEERATQGQEKKRIPREADASPPFAKPATGFDRMTTAAPRRPE
jgi:hypothetical protein